MIRGRVTANREATIGVAVAGPEHRLEAVDAVIDPGFNGFQRRGAVGRVHRAGWSGGMTYFFLGSSAGLT